MKMDFRRDREVGELPSEGLAVASTERRLTREGDAGPAPAVEVEVEDDGSSTLFVVAGVDGEKRPSEPLRARWRKDGMLDVSGKQGARNNTTGQTQIIPLYQMFLDLHAGLSCSDVCRRAAMSKDEINSRSS